MSEEIKKQKAGRPLGGEKKGGRQKGALNKASLEQIRITTETGITPLEYMLQVMREIVPDGITEESKVILLNRKIDAAKSAAPYVHSKLSSIEVKAEIETIERVISAEPLSEEEWEEQYEK